MKVERPGWRPITVTFETVEECQIVYKILDSVSDSTTERDMAPLGRLLLALGEGWTDSNYDVVGSLEVVD